ncbi:hypothetical protein GCM10009122_05020 [Fulvivirga kasyanovii]
MQRKFNELVTDHFIIIAGKYKDGDRWYYHYLDPGTRWANGGRDKEKNRLYINGEKVQSGKKTLSQIRVNKNDK